MSNYRVVFSTTSVNDLTFVDATVATDGDLTVVLKDGERTFAVPTASIIAIEKLPPRKAEAPQPEEPPTPA